MIIIRGFRLEDLDLISPIESAVPHSISKGNHLFNGLHWTLDDGGQILACGGVMRTTPGVGTGWLYADKCIVGDRHRIMATLETSADAISEAHAWWQMRRVQANAFVDNPRDIRWLLRLGFISEGVMRYTGPNGEHAILFAHYAEGCD